MAIINFYKEEGETPLEAVHRFQIKARPYRNGTFGRDSRFLNSKITYAGRLDPLAEGVLILLTDDDVHKKEDFLKLPKEYEFEVLFGFKTDTGDILGKILENYDSNFSIKEAEAMIPKILPGFLGKSVQTYPVYSSKTVAGKPLFTYARNEKEVRLPVKDIEIFSIEYLGSKEISSGGLLSDIVRRIGKVRGDFRQSEILNLWTYKLTDLKTDFVVSKFKVSASSGFYVRVLAEQIGEKIGTPSLAYRIKRTKVGNYHII